MENKLHLYSIYHKCKALHWIATVFGNFSKNRHTVYLAD